MTPYLLSLPARHRIRFAALLIALVSTAAPASGYQPGASPDENWQRIIAASPQRELARAWEQCVANIAAVMLPQRGTVRQFQELGIGGCEAEQSRLTGALVREFGYDRANRAVATRVVALIGDYEQRLALINKPPLPPDATERTADGWMVQRINGACTAYLLEQTAFGTRAAILSILPEGEFLLLREYGGDVRSRARDMRDGDTLTVSANVVRNSNILRRLTLPMTVSVREGGYGFYFQISPELADALSNANSLHFQADVGSMVARPHSYPLSGLAAARAAVTRCARV